jgi:uncharacterized protein YunC (DUF1805 family)
MTILKAKDDFWCRSLAALEGPLSRLEYVVGLRQESGVYAHWGMVKSHGEAAANQAIAGAHSQVFVDLLRTPLRRLTEELQGLAIEHGMDARELIRTLESRGEILVPQSLSGGSKQHFSSILKALSALARAAALHDGPTA